MVIVPLLGGILLAVVVLISFIILLQIRDIRVQLPWLFIILFLSIWSVVVWMRPFNPALLGLYLLPYIAVAVLFLMLYFVLRHEQHHYSDAVKNQGYLDPTRVTQEELEGPDATRRIMRIYMALLIALIGAALLCYFIFFSRAI